MYIAKINNNYPNTNFKGFNISYNAEETLEKVPVRYVEEIFSLAKKVEYLNFVDVELLSDLKFRIKQNGKNFSWIKEPFYVHEPQNLESKVKVTGIYDGVENDNVKRGQEYEVYIDYASHAEALKGYNIIRSNHRKLDIISAIANEIDNSQYYQLEQELKSRYNRKRIPLYSVLMSKYGNIVKEFTD